MSTPASLSVSRRPAFASNDVFYTAPTTSATMRPVYQRSVSPTESIEWLEGEESDRMYDIDEISERASPSFAFSPYLETTSPVISPRLSSQHAFASASTMPLPSAYPSQAPPAYGTANDFSSGISQKRKTVQLSPDTRSGTGAFVPNFARPLLHRTPSSSPLKTDPNSTGQNTAFEAVAASALLGSSTQRSRRMRSASQTDDNAPTFGANSIAGQSSPSPMFAQSPTMSNHSSPSSSSSGSPSTSLPVTPPTPNESTLKKQSPLTRSFYTLKNASTPNFGRISGPIRGLGVALDDSATMMSSPRAFPSTRSPSTPAPPAIAPRKSSLKTEKPAKGLSKLFGLAGKFSSSRKKVPDFIMSPSPALSAPPVVRQPIRPVSLVPSLVPTIPESLAEVEGSPDLSPSSASDEDDFESYAQSIYSSYNYSNETLTGIFPSSSSRDESRFSFPAKEHSSHEHSVSIVTLDELTQVRASVNMLYENVRRANPSVAKSHSVRRKPVPAWSSYDMNTLPLKVNGNGNSNSNAESSRRMNRAAAPPKLDLAENAMHSRKASSASSEDFSDNAPTLTPSLCSGQTTVSSASSNRSFFDTLVTFDDSNKVTVVSSETRSPGSQSHTFELEVLAAPEADQDERARQRRVSGIFVEKKHITGSWVDRIKKQTSRIALV